MPRRQHLQFKRRIGVKNNGRSSSADILRVHIPSSISDNFSVPLLGPTKVEARSWMDCRPLSEVASSRLVWEEIFYAEEETEEMVLEQWEDLKVEINVPTQQLSQHLS